MRVAVAAAAVAAVLLAMPAHVRGESPVAADVVLVIDHSASMADSDPAGRRSKAARDLIDAIATFTDSFDIRIAGVAFGSPYLDGGDPRINLPLTDAAAPGVGEQFSVERMPGTDFHSALCLAWRVAVGMRPPMDANCPPTDIDAVLGSAPSEDPSRKKAIVLVTDGGPAPRGSALTQASDGEADCPPIAPTEIMRVISSTNDEGVYMCALAKSWEALNAAFPVDLFVVGIDARDQWFPSTAAFWRGITACEGEQACAHRVVRVLDPAVLTREISKIATGGVTNLCAKDEGVSTCILPAGLREVHFAVTNVEPDDQITVKNPKKALNNRRP